MTRTAKQQDKGIVVRHARSCAYRVSGCTCKPTYQPWVWSPRDRKKIRGTTFSTRAAAKGWRVDALAALRRGRLSAPTGITFRAAAEALVTGMKDGTIRQRGGQAYKPSTIRSYERAIATLVAEFGGMRLERITRNDFEDYAVALQRQGLDGSSITNRLMPARVVYRRAVRRGQVAVNPTRDLELPAPGRRERRIAPPKEFRPFLAALSVADRAAWGLFFLAGLRLGEVLGLCWTDVDLAEGIVTIVAAWDAGEQQLVEPKSRSGKRRIALTSQLREFLADHRANSDGDGFVFPGQGGRPLSPSTLHRRGRKAAESAGVPWTSPHAARKTFSTLLHAAGADDVEMVKTMGHSSVVTTKDIYTSLLPGDERRIAEKLEKFLDAQR